MRVPDPKANTTTEAYLAYKAGFLEESELKPVLYKPYLHFDAWLAYWAGLTNEYPLDKNGDPECLTDEEALVAYLAGVTDTYPEEVKDPYDVRIVGYLKYLVSVRWGRPEYPVNNEEFYLSTMKPAFVPSGDPSSSIDLEGTAEAPFFDLKMYGDTYQKSYSGKNVCGIPNQTFTFQGVDITIEDGEITMNGTAIASNIRYISLIKPTVLDGDYTTNLIYVSGGIEGSTTTNINLRRASDHALISNTQTKIEENNSSVAYSVQNESIELGLYIYPAETVFNNLKFKIQIVAGTTPDYDFEPYVGGVASPNPDYPQTVNTVTGEQVVNVSGKNLINYLSDRYIVKGATATISGDDVVIAKIREGAFRYSIYKLTAEQTNNLLGKSISISYIKNSSVANVVSGVRIYWIEEDTTELGSQLYDGTNTTTGAQSFSLSVPSTPPDNTKPLLALLFYPDTTNSPMESSSVMTVSNLQLEEGDTATDFVPYQAQSYPINLGSIELCKVYKSQGQFQDYIYRDGEDWYLHKETGKIIFDGTESWTYDQQYSRVVLDNIPNIIPSRARELRFFCSHFIVIYDRRPVASVEVNECYAGAGSLYIHTSMTLADFKAFLATQYNAGTPVTIVYPLDTQTDTQITDSELIAQLDALMEGGSYEGETRIRVSANNPNLPGLLYVEAAKYD